MLKRGSKSGNKTLHMRNLPCTVVYTINVSLAHATPYLVIELTLTYTSLPCSSSRRRRPFVLPISHPLQLRVWGMVYIASYRYTL